MAERQTRTGITLSSIPEDYQAPANATPEEATRAKLASAMREGGRRAQKRAEAALGQEQAKHEAHTAGIKNAHLDELNRSGKIVSRAAHRDGLLQGIIAGMALAIALAFSTWVILREIVITNVATQRVAVPGDGIPELIDRERPTQYERNRREPPDAP